MTQLLNNEMETATGQSPVLHEQETPLAYALEPPNLVAASSSPDLNTAESTPTREQCLAHLKLMAAFSRLREDVTTTDGLFGISNSLVPERLNEVDYTRAVAKIGEKRWAVYVTKAVSRFEEWYTKGLARPQGLPLDPAELNVDFPMIVQGHKSLDFTKDNLPPIDVIMVWRSYMVNSRSFLEDCIRNAKMRFWTTGLPLAVIDSCIDDRSLKYSGTREAQHLFEETVGIAWNSLNDLRKASVDCPQCGRSVKWAWTTYGETPFSRYRDRGSGRGFADKKFCVPCIDCEIIINHETLRVSKFRRNVQELLLEGVPMPGTILGVDGTPKPSAAYDVRFPNRLIQAGLKSALLECTEPSLEYRSVAKIRTAVENGLRDVSLVERARKTWKDVMIKDPENISIRWVMSRYWDNSSIFSIDLVGAVMRQGIFIEVMASIDWLHSSAIATIPDWLITKYSRYFESLEKDPSKVAFPRLPVDVAWYTHQLSPSSYYDFSIRRTGTFVDHDERIDDSELCATSEWAYKTCEEVSASVYSECTCWYCSAAHIRDSFTDVDYRDTKKESRWCVLGEIVRFGCGCRINFRK